MSAGNNRRENTFKTKDTSNAEPLEELLTDTEENKKD